MSAPGEYQPPQNPPPSAPTPSRTKRKVSPGQVVGGILIVLVLVFIFENTGDVDVRLIFPKVHAPLFVALLIAAALGSLGTLLIQWRRHRKQ